MGFSPCGCKKLGTTERLILTFTYSLTAQLMKNPPAMQEVQVQSLNGKVPLEEGMATHPNILAWKISWTEEPGEL